MKAYEFPTRVTPEGRLDIPPEVAKHLPAGRAVRAIVLVDEPTDDEGREWARLAAEQFSEGYDEVDAIYDEP